MWYLNDLVVFPSHFNLSLNLAIRSTWSEPVSSLSCFCWLYRAFLSLAAKNIINQISVLTIWWCPRVVQFSSIQFSRSVMSDSLPPHELQHTRPPCPSPTPGVHSDSRPSDPWSHLAVSSSVVPFSSCPQPLPASESFPMSQLFTWGGQVLEFQL